MMAWSKEAKAAERRRLETERYPAVRYVVERKATQGSLAGRYFPEFITTDRDLYRWNVGRVRQRWEGRQDLIARCVLIDEHGRRLRERVLWERPARMQ